MKCLVLDYGGSAIKYCVMDDQSNITYEGSVPAPRESLEQFVDVSAGIYESVKDEVEGIAISFPGNFDPETGVVVNGGAYLHLVKDLSVTGLLKERCPVPMTMLNDGKAAGMAEAWKGNLKDVDTGAAIVLGTGIGGCLIKDGNVILGKHFAAGEFSPIITGDGNYITRAATFSCSTTGIVERAAIMKGARLSAPVYVKLMEHLCPEYIDELRAKAVGPQYPDLEMNGFELFRLLEEGDPDIKMLYDEFIASNVGMIINVANIYDPARIVIGGGISKEPRLIADLQQAVRNIASFGMTVVTDIDLQPCYYRSSANLYGAMYGYLLKYHPELITH